ncbi:uncharacterized protein Pyn_13799 [Prunus yedoensis var. nudiflora]|uniref:Uncharacterized protein n=1 Tax=Prunus yedoensis var. nudiflora TaxID=2094558 RepID=A0A314ZD91_PRUYE|nr:uncharacterized protein Pyn_13799 [Prunus yedoensis var. nudiflora]
MSGNGHCFVEWKEHFVSQERGNRVVHYFLKDSAGESILAVVGTERSVRHMFYVVSEEFLHVHGKESSTNANFKWRSKKRGCGLAYIYAVEAAYACRSIRITPT